MFHSHSDNNAEKQFRPDFLDTSTPVIYVVIAVFNRSESTRRCLRLLRQQTYTNLKIIVVDDASTDGTAEMLRNDFPDVTVLQGTGSLYWTGSMRLGVEYVLARARASDYLLVLNNDLTFDESLVQALLKASNEHPSALVHALGLFAGKEGLIEFGGRRMNGWTGKSVNINFQKLASTFPPGHYEESDFVWGRGLLIPLPILRDIGNYDRRFQQTGDAELARRAARKGYDLLVIYDARVVLQLEVGEPNNIVMKERFTPQDFHPYFFGVLSQARIRYVYLHSTLNATSKLQGWTLFLFKMARYAYRFILRLRLRDLSNQERAERKYNSGAQ